MTAPSLPALNRSMELRADNSPMRRHADALRDVWDGLAQWRLAVTLGWLDIKLRYRGSILGPFWLTLSTAVMVMAMGVLYAELFKMELQGYMPFLALSLVLWNTLSAIVTDACVCFTSAEGTIRSIRMPFLIYAGRAVVRNALTLGHNVVVIIGVFAYFNVWPGAIAAQSLLGLCFWFVDAMAACLLLGTFCARVPRYRPDRRQHHANRLLHHPDHLADGADRPQRRLAGAEPVLHPCWSSCGSRC